MFQDGDKLDFINLRNGGRKGNAPGAWKKRWLVFDSDCALFLQFGELQLNMQYARGLENCAHVTRLLLLVILLKGVSNF